MPFDWLLGIERTLIRLVPAYTLETLDTCDIDRILPYYFYDYRLTLREQKRTEEPESVEGEIVIRNGKKYRKVNIKDSKCADKIFN